MYEQIPDEMKQRRNWLCHLNKIPVTANGSNHYNASVNNPEHWSSYTRACTVASAHPVTSARNQRGETVTGAISGISYVLDGTGIVCLDLDDVISDDGRPASAPYVDDGKVKFLPVDILSDFGAAYIERSCSGHGLHVFFRADPQRVNPIIGNGKSKRVFSCNLEVYSTRKVIAMTGNKYGDGEPVKALPDYTDQLIRLLHTFSLDTVDNHTNHANHAECTETAVRDVFDPTLLSIGLERDMRLNGLYNGTVDLGDVSRTDLALFNKLAHWCNRDIDAMISAFLSSPYAQAKDEVHKAKQQRSDYLRKTAVKAAYGCKVTAADIRRDYDERMKDKKIR